MLQTTKSVTISGQSIIENEGVQSIVVIMNANISENGEYSSTSRTIQNKELYIANKASCKEDISKFDDMIDKYVGGTDDKN